MVCAKLCTSRNLELPDRSRPTFPSHIHQVTAPVRPGDRILSHYHNLLHERKSLPSAIFTEYDRSVEREQPYRC